MRQQVIMIYQANELEEDARKRAWGDFQNTDFHNEHEYGKTINEFANLFPIRVSEWYYNSMYPIDFTFTEDSDIEKLSGLRLATYIQNNYGDKLFKGKYYSTIGKYIDGKYTYKHRHSKVIFENSCVLTGYFMDDNILEPIYRFLKNPDKDINFKQLMRECLRAFQDTIDGEYEYYYSMENFIDMSINNEWEYLSNGESFVV